MINFYAQSEKLLEILKSIADTENFACDFHLLKAGTRINPNAENFFIVRNFPVQPV